MTTILYRSGLFFILAAMLWSCKDENDVKACFCSEISDIAKKEVQFVNCSENATSFRWDFGDGHTSNEKNPTHIFETDFPVVVTLTAINGKHTNVLAQQVPPPITVYKPNIYLYPTKSLPLSVSISFPWGGNVIESIPDYGNGWSVHVSPNGIIDNRYNYLFYESTQPDVFQYQKGWCIAKNQLKSFFTENMSLYNFSEAEINDFNAYWLSRLTDYDYYLIYPQTNEIIDAIIQLEFSEKPDNVNRLFYGIKGTNSFTSIQAPSIAPFKRTGFFVMEWGVFLK